MYNLRAFKFASTQNTTPVPSSLYNNNETVSAEDLTKLYDTNIPEELSPIDEAKAQDIEIDEEFTESLSHSLAKLIKSIPSDPLPNFIPRTPLNQDVNIQAEVDKILNLQTQPPPPPPTTTNTNTNTSSPAHHFPYPFHPQQTSTPPSSPLPPPPPPPPHPHPQQPLPHHLYYQTHPQQYSYCAYPYSINNS